MKRRSGVRPRRRRSRARTPSTRAQASFPRAGKWRLVYRTFNENNSVSIREVRPAFLSCRPNWPILRRTRADASAAAAYKSDAWAGRPTTTLGLPPPPLRALHRADRRAPTLHIARRRMHLATRICSATLRACRTTRAAARCALQPRTHYSRCVAFPCPETAPPCPRCPTPIVAVSLLWAVLAPWHRRRH